jgi:hypothetical protein
MHNPEKLTNKVMCLVYPILSVSLDCPYLIALHYSLTFICPVSCVPYFVSFSRLSISDCHSLFSNVYLSVSLDCTYLIAFHLSLTFKKKRKQKKQEKKTLEIKEGQSDVQSRETDK